MWMAVNAAAAGAWHWQRTQASEDLLNRYDVVCRVYPSPATETVLVDDVLFDSGGDGGWVVETSAPATTPNR